MDEFAERQDYIEKYRFEYGFHPVHGLMATFPLKRLKHAARVYVAGSENEAAVKHLGFIPTDTVEEAIEQARSHHGPHPTIGLVKYPFAINRS